MQVKLKFPSFARFALPKQLLQNSYLRQSKFLAAIFIILLFTVGLVLRERPVKNVTTSKFGQLLTLPTPIPTPTPTPTPRPLTLAEMNALYGPCVQLPVLMYHHIQSKDSAIANHQTALTVDTTIFKGQMQYLKDRNYNIASMSDLINFFDNGTPIAKKSVLLTFDDGYQDFYTDAYPILGSMGFKATMFIPTGLIQNPDYLTWDEILTMTGLILFTNHTWSHKSVVTQDSVMKMEISTADTQLGERGLNSPKIFAYPYGPDSISAEDYLNSLGYKAAFTTKSGNILCKQKRFDLPRVRIGNIPLSSYGF